MDAYFDCFAGISGNMILGALFDLGLKREKWEKHMAGLGLSEEYEFILKKKKKMGLQGTFAEVKPIQDKNAGVSEKDDICHGRHLKDIKEIICSSGLDKRTIEKSLQVFEILAEAEAIVHGISAGEVHFHEVGAVDAIVDITGSILGLEILDVDRIIASPLHTGRGFTECDHGRLPVPAPATVEILRDIPIYSEGIESELVTPTGAALIKFLADDYASRPKMKIKNTGYGAGSRELAIPNFLRINLGNFLDTKISGPVSSSVKSPEKVVTKLSTNIDDMNPEFYQYVMDRLFQAGALDVYLIPIYMKKNRPGTILNVICAGEDEEKMSEIILRETSSLGIRIYRGIERECLQRKKEEVKTPWGSVDVKLAYKSGQLVNISPEFEDCRRVAGENDMPIQEVYRQVNEICSNELWAGNGNKPD